MREIQELIDELGKPGSDLEDALIKAQVVAHEVDDAEFSAWVRSELEGYETANVPDYRKMGLVIMGTIGNGVYFQRNQPIAVQHLSDIERERLLHHSAKEGIGGIKLHAEHEKAGQKFGFAVPPELCVHLSEAYMDGAFVQSAYLFSSSGAWQQILTQIRTRLLRFALTLKKRVQSTSQEGSALPAVEPAALSHLLNGATFGNNTTINIGHNGTISNISNSSRTGDLAELIRTVKQQGVDDQTAADLEQAIASDNASAPPAPGQFGERVRGWLGKLGRIAGTATITVAAKEAIEVALHAYLGHG